MQPLITIKYRHIKIKAVFLPCGGKSGTWHSTKQMAIIILKYSFVALHVLILDRVAYTQRNPSFLSHLLLAHCDIYASGFQPRGES